MVLGNRKKNESNKKHLEDNANEKAGIFRLLKKRNLFMLSDFFFVLRNFVLYFVSDANENK